MELIPQFSEEIERLGLAGRRLLAAVSGGPDSVVLLDLLVQVRQQHRLDLLVAHADHGIHPDSHRVAEQVEALAASYGVPCEVGRLALGAGAGETAAREARYAWLQEVRLRLRADYILTAHHADDQTETVLMRVLAGSGMAGLAGMTPVRGALVRPLLTIRRGQLESYRQERGLAAWQDPANRDQRHLRSWIREAVLPLLGEKVPEVDVNLRRLAEHASGHRSAWQSALELLPGLDLRVEPEGISVAAPVVAGYDSALSYAVISAAGARAGCRVGPRRMARIMELVRKGASGASVPLGGGCIAELSFGRLRILTSAESSRLAHGAVEGTRGSWSWDRWQFHWEMATAPERQDRAGLSAWFTPAPLEIRSWKLGEKVRPLGASGRRLIVRCFQDSRVPRSRRNSWPVLAQENDIIWIPGVCRSDALLPARGAEALRIDAEYS